ncbi:MAG TPA: hypothetical protein VE736_07350 [Gaiellaceae bacterium]|nr:hypothetical protein [Gaiellaceae bacterium]
MSLVTVGEKAEEELEVIVGVVVVDDVSVCAAVLLVSVEPDDDVALVSVAAAVVSVLPEDVMPGTPLSASATEASSPATRSAPNPRAIRPRRISCHRLFISFALCLILRAMP